MNSVSRQFLTAVFTFFAFAVLSLPASAGIKAGAAAIDVTPLKLPVLVNGGMTSRSSDKATSPLFARALVLDDGLERIAIVVVDSCMMPKILLDDAKHLAAQRTQIKPDRIMISATHTHTAPASMGCLGTDADPDYVPFLREKLAEAIQTAESRLEPAQVGWASADAHEFTALRRWIIRPDRMIEDPFGNKTVRANMHAGANLDNVTGESGPEDPELSILCIRAIDGRMISLLANFSMHYFSGVDGLNYDYFGLFCEGLEKRFGGSSSHHPPAVAILSHGCSGDIWRRDYTKSEWANPSIQDYTQGLLKIAESAIASVSFEDADSLAMAETRLPLKYRVPNKQLLEWSQRIVAQMGDRLPQTTEEVYAREQIFLNEMQSTEVVIQGIRIGRYAIATTPCETYAVTGLKLKLQSPAERTMVIELANGGDGYIPPAEQHPLGGYNTWAARSAGLEVQAEGKIAEAALELLESVTNQTRRSYEPQLPPAVTAAMLNLKPAAWWRLHEFAPPHAFDASGNDRHAVYEPGVVFFLEGPDYSQHMTLNAGDKNRAPHFAGGRLRAVLPVSQQQFAVSLWIWNGMPNDGRPVSGWFISQGSDHGVAVNSLHAGVSGTSGAPGHLILQMGNGLTSDSIALGKTEIPRWTWSHVILVRSHNELRAYVNGSPEPDAVLSLPESNRLSPFSQWFFGGRSDNDSNWEGRLDEIAVFDRALEDEDLQTLRSILIEKESSSAVNR